MYWMYTQSMVKILLVNDLFRNFLQLSGFFNFSIENIHFTRVIVHYLKPVDFNLVQEYLFCQAYCQSLQKERYLVNKYVY